MTAPTTSSSLENEVWCKVGLGTADVLMVSPNVRTISDLKTIIFDARHRFAHEAFVDGVLAVAIDPIPTGTSYDRPIHFKVLGRASCE
jgi:hypothetical protein